MAGASGPTHSGCSLPKSKAAGGVNLQSGRVGFLQVEPFRSTVFATVGEEATLGILLVTVNEC